MILHGDRIPTVLSFEQHVVEVTTALHVRGVSALIEDVQGRSVIIFIQMLCLKQVGIRNFVGHIGDTSLVPYYCIAVKSG